MFLTSILSDKFILSLDSVSGQKSSVPHHLYTEVQFKTLLPPVNGLGSRMYILKTSSHGFHVSVAFAINQYSMSSEDLSILSYLQACCYWYTFIYIRMSFSIMFPWGVNKCLPFSSALSFAGLWSLPSGHKLSASIQSDLYILQQDIPCVIFQQICPVHL